VKRLQTDDPVAEAAEELQHLRAIARAAHRHALARVEAEIVRVLRCVSENPGDTAHDRRRDIRRIAKELKNFNIRPEKGRSKDLRRLDWLVNHLAGIVDEWS